jgi:hypothetical protein
VNKVKKIIKVSFRFSMPLGSKQGALLKHEEVESGFENLIFLTMHHQ